MKSPTTARHGCCGRRKIASRNRFCTTSAVDLTPAEVAFGDAMQKYLARFRRSNATAGMILDVLMSLGYLHERRDFVANGEALANALAVLRSRPNVKFLTWSEALKAARKLGWRNAAAGEEPAANKRAMARKLIGLGCKLTFNTLRSYPQEKLRAMLATGEAGGELAPPRRQSKQAMARQLVELGSAKSFDTLRKYSAEALEKMLAATGPVGR